MAEALSRARAYANRVRFSGDHPPPFAHVDEIKNEFQKAQYQDAIEISEALTPALWRRVEIVSERLLVPTKAISPFVYSSPNVQAECLATDSDQCFVRFSSGLLDLLTEDEFEFVLGHEVAHFLLRHRPLLLEEASPNRLILQRSKEISADRIGLVACKSLDVALRALMKSVSGLTERHLRFDVTAFIAQLRKIDGVSTDWSGATHPTIIVRAKALLWFSLCDFRETHIDQSTQAITLLNERVERDLRKFIDGAIKKLIDRTKTDLMLWMMTYEIMQLGPLSDGFREKMRAIFEDDVISKLTLFLETLEKAEADSVIYEKLVQARSQLETLIPQSFAVEYSEMQKRVTTVLSAV